MSPFELRAGEVHIWVADLDVPPSEVATCWELLAADERERAERLRFEQLRVRYVAGRGILRQLLGRYLQVAPNQLVFCYGPYGKPGLAAPSELAFNLAHSHSVAVYALAMAKRIGVDVEHMRPVHERDQIVERFFSARERQTLAALPASQRDEAFFLGWTRKEAYLKALGAGMTYPLDRFSVSLIPGAPPALLEVGAAESTQLPWTLLHFEPAPLYPAAVAIEGKGWQAVRRRWPL